MLRQPDGHLDWTACFAGFWAQWEGEWAGTDLAFASFLTVQTHLMSLPLHEALL